VQAEIEFEEGLAEIRGLIPSEPGFRLLEGLVERRQQVCGKLAGGLGWACR
jgi:hypothetical protein